MLPQRFDTASEAQGVALPHRDDCYLHPLSNLQQDRGTDCRFSKHGLFNDCRVRQWGGHISTPFGTSLSHRARRFIYFLFNSSATV